MGERAAHGAGRGRVVVLSALARQPEVLALLADAGFEVDLHTRPLAPGDEVRADAALVFRGRTIGPGQPRLLRNHGVPVVEVLTIEPPTASQADWIRVSRRMPKSDLVQLVHALVDRASSRAAA